MVVSILVGIVAGVTVVAVVAYFTYMFARPRRGAVARKVR
jgi:gas vesicle protein